MLLASCASADKDKGSAAPVKELAVAGARIHGGGIRMDVQVGRTLITKPGAAGATKILPNAVVQP
jgi:hypothetical protein